MRVRIAPQNAGAAAVIFFLVFWLAAIGGYIANLVKLVGAVIANEPLGTLVIARVVGLFAAPLGAILGYF